MASDAGSVDHVLDQAGLGGRLVARRMFGEYALYLDGKVVAFVCDNRLHLKPTEAARPLLPQVEESLPYPRARPHWCLDALLDDRELLRRVLLATADALPPPQPRRRRPAARA